jgi:hypothetical protein
LELLKVIPELLKVIPELIRTFEVSPWPEMYSGLIQAFWDFCRTDKLTDQTRESGGRLKAGEWGIRRSN